MNENPWCHLPNSPPYVLPKDEEYVRVFNGKVGSGSDRFLQIRRILPEPFIGDPSAPVVLLSNNPGFGRRAPLKETRNFMERLRKNLILDESEYPFLFLDPDFNEVGWWWRIKLKVLLRQFGDKIIARSILNVPFFPYPSRRYRHGPLRVPSQDYSFHLVREAMKRDAVIVRMRKCKGFLNTLPELQGYDRHFHVENFQFPAISPKNCYGFQDVVQAIEAAEAKKQES
jgi:hypothetical protein